MASTIQPDQASLKPSRPVAPPEDCSAKFLVRAMMHAHERRMAFVTRSFLLFGVGALPRGPAAFGLGRGSSGCNQKSRGLALGRGRGGRRALRLSQFAKTRTTHGFRIRPGGGAGGEAGGESRIGSKPMGPVDPGA